MAGVWGTVGYWSEESSKSADVVEDENASSVALGNEEFSGALVHTETEGIIHWFIEWQRQNTSFLQR